MFGPEAPVLLTPRKRSYGLLSTLVVLSVSAGSPSAVAQPEAADAGARNTALTLEEVVVTAQRREERAQDVPIVITAFSSERLQQMNVDEAQDLFGSVPSLVSGSQGQGNREVQSYSIRGQGATFQAAPAVALYLNDVPLPSSISLHLQGGAGNYVDLENIQVLSGPQGTLFGRNTTGGAVLLVPRKPTNEFEGSLQAAAGNYDLEEYQGIINIPVIDDRLLVRAVGSMQRREGYTDDVLWNKDRDDVDWYSGRLGVTVNVSENLSNYLMAYGSKSTSNGAGQIHEGFNIPGLQGVGFCVDPPLSAPGPSGIAVPCDVYREQTEIAEELGPRKNRLGIDQFSSLKTWGVTNTTDYQVTPEWLVRNIISYQELESDYSYDGDATPLQQYENQGRRYPDFPVPGLQEYGLPLAGYLNAVDLGLPRDNLKQFTDELQLQGTLLDGDLTLTVGGFYYDAKPDGLWAGTSINYCPAAFTGLCTQNRNFSGVSNKSEALFAQGTLNLGRLSPGLEDLQFTAGFRRTWDEVSGFSRAGTIQPDGMTVSCNSSGEVVPVEDFAVRCRISDTLKTDADTWTFGLDYRAMDDLLLYGKVSRGFKAGGFNSFAVRPETITFEPEELTTYEVGFKSDWMLGAAPTRLNMSYYYSDYENIQRATGDFNPATGASGAQVLAATATIKGVEADFSVRPLPGLEIGGILSYTDATYDDFTFVSLAPTTACNGAVAPGEQADVSCIPFQFVSEWIYSLRTVIDVPVPERVGEVSLFVNYVHIDEQNTDPIVLPENQPGAILDSYGLLNASIEWRDVAGSGVDLSLFGDNLTDKLYRVGNTNVFTVGSLLTRASLYGPPRMYGMRLRYNFGG